MMMNENEYSEKGRGLGQKELGGLSTFKKEGNITKGTQEELPER